MTTVRLDEQMEKKLNTYADMNNISKSDVIKEALSEYFSSHYSNQNSYDLGSDLFGSDGSGDGQLSKTYKQRLKQDLDAKYNR